MKTTWHTLSASQVLEDLRTRERGLSGEEVQERLKEYGPNALPEPPEEGLILAFIRQFQSPLIYILFAAALALLLTGQETSDAVIIFAVLIFNAIVGTVQEGRAQRTLRALKHLVETNARVIRDGKDAVVAENALVPGDIIVLDEGARVPADVRVIAARSLKADESSLTGESVPVHKTAEAMRKEDAAIAEQHNMLFMGTTIVAGSGHAVVVAIAGSTEIGSIAQKISGIDSEVPLKANIRQLSRAIIAVVAIVSGILFLLGIYEGQGAAEMFATVVSLSVSVIPEGLPIVMTLVLASGVWRMSRRNVLVKKLHAVEALGQARILAVDKTGTITRNELTVKHVWTGGRLFDVEGSGYDPRGLVALEGHAVEAAEYPDLIQCGKAATLSANARPIFSEKTRSWRVVGDPTEAAMFVLAQKVGLHRDTLEGAEPLIAEIPFDYRLKYHAALYGTDDHRHLYVAGAPEEILALSSTYVQDGKHHPLSAHRREELEATFEKMSEKGLRVVACAMHDASAASLEPESVRDLTFVGFLGMKDTLRSEVHESTRRAHEAGIRVVMITGDHVITAKAIAKDAGIFRSGDKVLSGHEIDSLSDVDLAAAVGDVSIFARVTPEHKLRIINAYKSRGLIVAMTGDGVNDAPSLVAADLGVAMGGIGTEVAKEAADLVLLDDNFGSVVSAVEEGRGIYRTIQKVILYLFSTSAGEVLTIMGALLLGLPLPLLAVQIIWLNFVTDGFLDVALGMEPKEKNLLEGTFDRPKKYLINSVMAARMALMSLTMAAGGIGLFVTYLFAEPEKAGAVALTVLAVFQWFNAWNCRSEKESLFRMNPFSNRYLLGATGIVILLQLLAVYTPFFHTYLHTVPLSLYDWGLIIAVASTIIVVEEVRKLLHRARTSA